MLKKGTVLDWLETAPSSLPAVLTVDRMTESKYLFYLIVRYFRKVLQKSPRFVGYSRVTMSAVKGQLEEHSVFGDPGLFVLEGFAEEFVQSLSLPKGVCVIAETDGGELKAPPYSYRLRRDIIKVLIQQLRIRHLSLRPLIQLDWTSCRDYGDYEIVLRLARLMEWNEEQIDSYLVRSSSGPVFSLTKRGQFKDIFSMVDKYGASWMLSHIQEVLCQTAHLKALKLLGYDEERAGRDLEVGIYRMRELEETARVLSREDLEQMAQRLVGLDKLMQLNKELGLSLYLLNSPIRISK